MRANLRSGWVKEDSFPGWFGFVPEWKLLSTDTVVGLDGRRNMPCYAE